MPDVWSRVTELEPALQDQLAGVLETRGADSRQRDLRRQFLTSFSLPPQARVLEVGCGTGVLSRVLAAIDSVGSVVGVDPAASLVKRARELATGLANLEFLEADGRALPFEDSSFDAVVFDSTLSHVPEPERALSEAFRVTRPGGTFASFDGDYATATVAIGDDDPLQTCVEAMMAGSVNDRWLMRRLPALLRAQGFDEVDLRSYGFADGVGGSYMLSVVDRGVDILWSSGRLSAKAAEALKAESLSIGLQN